MQFSQNYIAIYGASFKAQKVMLPPLKCQIFCFWSKFVYTKNSLHKKYNFPKSGLVIFKYMWQNSFIQTIKKIHRVDPDKNASKIGGQTNRWAGKQGWFYWTPSAKMKVWLCFWKFENKIFLNYLAWLWAIWKESIQENKKKEYNQHNSVFKEFKNNDPWQI